MEEYNLKAATYLQPNIDDIMPNDIMIEIFYYLKEKDLSRASMVSKRFYKIASMRNFFRNFLINLS